MKQIITIRRTETLTIYVNVVEPLGAAYVEHHTNAPGLGCPLPGGQVVAHNVTGWRQIGSKIDEPAEPQAVEARYVPRPKAAAKPSRRKARR